jgi:hypothetical protein
MNATPERVINRIAALGLLVGAAFGLAGTFVGSPHLQASLWAIDSVGLVVATTLLALKFFRAGADVVAGGFLVFAIGEGVLLSGTAAGPKCQCARLRRRHGAVGGGPGPHQRHTAAAVLAPAIGRSRSLFVRCHGGAHLRGRGTPAHLVAAAVPRLSCPRCDLAGVGMDVGTRGVVKARLSFATGASTPG